MCKEDHIERQISRAKGGDVDARDELLDACREKLSRMAARYLDNAIGRRVDASDVIQETLLEAYQGFDQFNGCTEREFIAWAREILKHNASNLNRKHRALKREVYREVFIDEPTGDSPPLRDMLVGEHSTPSYRAMRNEQVDRLMKLVESLPPDQSIAVKMRHLENKTLDEIACEMDRSHSAVAGLVKRGMSKIHQQLKQTP